MDFAAKKREMQVEFHRLGKDKIALEAKLNPERDVWNQMRNKHREEESELSQKMQPMQAEMYDIDMNRAMLARALNGKTGDPLDF